MLEIVSLLFALALSYTTIADTKRTPNDQLIASMGLSNNVVGNCLKYPTVPEPSELVELTWNAVRSSSSKICTQFETKGTVLLSTSAGSKTGKKQVVSYLNNDGSITKDYYIRQNFFPGQYVLKKYSPNKTDTNFNSLRPNFVVSILKFTNDTQVLAVCPVKPNTHTVLTIWTTTGEMTSSVKSLEDYTKRIGITGDFQNLNLTKCNKFYTG